VESAEERARRKRARREEKARKKAEKVSTLARACDVLPLVVFLNILFPHQEAEKKRGKDKKKTQIKYDEYRRMSLLLVAHLKQRENVAAPEEEVAGQAEQAMLTWGELVDWYVAQDEEARKSEEEAARVRKLIKKVIVRMVDVDHSLMVEDRRGSADKEDWILRLHPNYAGLEQ
jgi:hypothetical protein